MKHDSHIIQKKKSHIFPSIEYQTITSSSFPAYWIHTMRSRTKACTPTPLFYCFYLHIYALPVFGHQFFRHWVHIQPSHHIPSNTNNKRVSLGAKTGSQCVQLETIRFTLRQLIKYHLSRGERRAELQQQRLINMLNFAEAEWNTHSEDSKRQLHQQSKPWKMTSAAIASGFHQ